MAEANSMLWDCETNLPKFLEGVNEELSCVVIDVLNEKCDQNLKDNAIYNLVYRPVYDAYVRWKNGNGGKVEEPSRPQNGSTEKKSIYSRTTRTGNDSTTIETLMQRIDALEDSQLALQLQIVEQFGEHRNTIVEILDYLKPISDKINAQEAQIVTLNSQDEQVIKDVKDLKVKLNKLNAKLAEMLKKELMVSTSQANVPSKPAQKKPIAKDNIVVVPGSVVHVSGLRESTDSLRAMWWSPKKSKTRLLDAMMMTDTDR